MCTLEETYETSIPVAVPPGLDDRRPGFGLRHALAGEPAPVRWQVLNHAKEERSATYVDAARGDGSRWTNRRNSFTEVTEMAAMRMRSHAYAAQLFGAILGGAQF